MVVRPRGEGEMQRSTDDSSLSTTPFRLSSVKKSHDLNPKTQKHTKTHTKKNNMSVQAAWDNHFSAFGEQNVEKILLDYRESEILIWDTKEEKTTKFKGLDGAKTCFTNLFGALSDLSTLKAPLVEVQEDPGMVFLVWECPGCGYKKVTDTFLFKGNKILRQNIELFK